MTSAAWGFPEDAEVSLEALVDLGILNPSGRDRRLPLKVSSTTTTLSLYYHSVTIKVTSLTRRGQTRFWECLLGLGLR